MYLTSIYLANDTIVDTIQVYKLRISTYLKAMETSTDVLSQFPTG